MKFTRTKIICTIGPASNKTNILKKLHKSGMNVARINMSHAKKELKKYFNKKKNLKFVMLSGIFSENHSEAIQIINF